MRAKRSQMRIVRVAATILGSIVLLVGSCELYRPSGPDVRTVEGKAAILARAEEIRGGVERYYAEHGAYPRRLADTDVPLRWADRAHGGWEYRERVEGGGYYLKLGDYLLDGFVLYVTDGDSEWNWDT